jgi:hypothetical protein
LRKHNIQDEKAINILLILWEYTHKKVFTSESWSIDKLLQIFDGWCSFVEETPNHPLSPATRVRLAFWVSKETLTDNNGKKLDSSKKIIKRYNETHNN